MDCIICLDQEAVTKDNAFLCEDCHEDNYLFDTCTECDCRCATQEGYWHEADHSFICDECAQEQNEGFLINAGEYHAGENTDWKYYNKALEAHKAKPKSIPAIKTTLSNVGTTLTKMVA